MRPTVESTVFVDFETPKTRSYNLNKRSNRAYILDPRFEVLSLAVAVGRGLIAFFHKYGPPGGTVADGINMVTSELAAGKMLVAHNLGFDALILKLRFGITASKMFDTKDYATSLGLGGSLDNLARHLGLRKLESPPFDEASLRDPPTLAQLARYNSVDVKIARRAFIAAVNDPRFMDEEFEVVDVTAKSNIAGLRIDSVRLTGIGTLLDEAKQTFLAELGTTTAFDTSKVNSLPAVGDFLEATHGERPASLDKKRDELPAFLRAHPDARPFISKWQTVRSLKTRSKQIKEYEALGGRVFSHLRYHAAHTGRFAGGGDACDKFSVQNFPKAKNSSHPAIGLLRTLIIPEDGENFVAADLATIEARVIATLANEPEMLQRFRDNEDLYVWLANQIFPGVTVVKDKTNDHLRMLCKAAVLGLGFGMGFDTFQGNILRTMPDTSPGDVRRVFDMFKATFPRLALLRRELWDAFQLALHTSDPQQAGRCTFVRADTGAEGGPTVLVELPSGRFLFYRAIQETPALTPWGAPCTDYWYADGYEYSTEVRHGKHGPKSKLFHDNRWRDRVNQTAVVENIVQATARDIFAHQMLVTARGGRLRSAFHVHDELVGACGQCTCEFVEWKKPDDHLPGCAWAGAARELIEKMSTVPLSLPSLADVPVAAELSKGVWRTYAG